MPQPAATARLGGVSMGQPQLSAGTMELVATMEDQHIAACRRHPAGLPRTVIDDEVEIVVDSDLETLGLGITAQFPHHGAVTADPDTGPALRERRFQRGIAGQGVISTTAQPNGDGKQAKGPDAGSRQDSGFH